MSDTAAPNTVQFKLASRAHLLFLLNITFLPVIAFVLLLINASSAPVTQSAFLQHHYRQSLWANIISGILLLGLSSLLLVIGDISSPYTWMTLLIYFTCIHSLLILLALYATVKTSAGVDYDYPVLGKFLRRKAA